MGTLMDYAELAVQFGYITLFVVAFPLAPFLALANNYVETRSDAFKLLTQMQRPVPRGAEDIGSWQQVFTIIACISVLTNSALVRNQNLSYSSHKDNTTQRGGAEGGSGGGEGGAPSGGAGGRPAYMGFVVRVRQLYVELRCKWHVNGTIE